MASVYEIQGVKKYIKIPDRRLISGFLTINVINHNDNDASKDDLASAVYDKWSSLGDPGSFSYQWNEARPTQGDDRDEKLQTFGDHEVMCFFVGGGMTLHAPVFGSRTNQSGLHGAGFLTADVGAAQWTDGTGSPSAAYDSGEDWYLAANFDHFCHHYIKHTPIARFNNAYSHIDTDHKRGHPLKNYKITAGSYANLGEGFSHANLNETTEYLYSNGTYDATDSSEIGLGAKSLGDFGGDLSDKDKNTYFTPVDRVKIYGEHQFTIPTHLSNDGSSLCYSNDETSVGDYSHGESFWNLVVDIGFLAVDANYGGGGDYTADIHWIKTRVNVAFFPFGETASFDIADSIFS